MTVPTATRPRSRPANSSTVPADRVGGRDRGPRVDEHGGADRGRADVRAPAVEQRLTELGLERRIWALTPGWATCSRSAARVKLPSSAIATRYAQLPQLHNGSC